MSRRLFPLLPFLFLVGCAQGYPSFSGILPDVRVSATNAATPSAPKTA